MKHYIFPILCLFMFSCSNQENDSFTIDLEIIYDQPERGFFILYPMSEMDDSLRQKIRFPDLSEISDTAFAKTFFTGNNQAAIENQVLILIGNHKSATPKLWVDYKNNLDFLDTGQPLMFTDDYFDLRIPNIDKPELAHIVRLYKAEASEKAQHKEMIEEFITAGNSYADFWFEQRRNIRVGDFVFEADSFRVGLMDWNINGTYNNPGTDRIVIGEYKGEIKGTDEASGAVLLDSTTYFQGASYSFEVIDLAIDGSSITIKPTLSSKIESRISEGQNMPDYSFELLSGEATSVYEFLDGQHHLYLNFWASWCVGCHQEIDDLKSIQTNHADKIRLVSLNYNEDIEKIVSFLDRYGVDWLNAYSTSEINEELFISGLPRNVLIDPSGVIVKMNIHPSMLLQQIDQL